MNAKPLAQMAWLSRRVWRDGSDSIPRTWLQALYRWPGFTVRAEDGR